MINPFKKKSPEVVVVPKKKKKRERTKFENFMIDVFVKVMLVIFLIGLAIKIFGWFF